MTIIVDASVVVAAFVDDGPDGRACEEVLVADHLMAPHLLPFEVANVIRRSTARGAIDPSEGALALTDINRLPIDLVPFAALSTRVWELRDNLTAYDGSYVALAELVDAQLITLDRRLAAAPGLRCEVLVI